MLTYAEAHNLGVTRSADGDLAVAERYLRQALAQRPDAPESRYSLAQNLLAQGRYAEAWPLYEARRELSRLSIPRGLPGVPEWRGEDLTGKRLVAVGEQGFGDQIMFSRFIPNGAAYFCSPALYRLFPGSAPAGSNVPLPEADFWALAGSLPRLRGSLAIPPPRLSVPLRSGGGIGVMARGNPSQANDHNRRLTETDASRLLSLGRDLSPEATGARDFLETAEIVAGLDLVIAVDTALAHLAATMGKPTWVLVPSVGTYWPWRRVEEWYPTAKLFPKTGASWGAALDLVETALLDRERAVCGEGVDGEVARGGDRAARC